ncbi:DUF3300 domain-containing protein [Aliikangiella sp. IMCC44359]|uniref:DUF3300 domain-containing protein n=1 Tax=Aliikangiella sp. IMCC44359 TaxID=3459125 RepID=UPI00403B006B
MMKRILTIFIVLYLGIISSASLAEDDQQSFSDAEIAQMLAPIALYPDSVLTHILIASTYPIELVQASRWQQQHGHLSPGEALDKVENKAWDPSVKALIPFPKILKKLAEDLEWTQTLGDAFLQDEKRLLASIQTLRRKADKVGSLDKMEHMEISRDDDNIVIQPVKREVVYIPYYDTRVVYGDWYWPHYPPVHWSWHHNYHYTHHRPFFWHPRVHISFNYFHSAFHWHNHHVIVIDRHHYHSRRYHHRRHILRDYHGRRWNHNPTHRRGVAYRTEHTRKQYRSSRPSIEQTRRVRHTERATVRERRGNSRQTDTRNKSRTNRATTNRSAPKTTRHERIRHQLTTANTRKEGNKKELTQNRENRRQVNTRTNHKRSYDNTLKREKSNSSTTNRRNQTQPKSRTEYDNRKYNNDRKAQPQRTDRHNTRSSSETQRPSRKTQTKQERQSRENNYRSNNNTRSERPKNNQRSTSSNNRRQNNSNRSSRNSRGRQHE